MESNYEDAVAIKYIIALVINTGISLIIAYYWGRKRRLGFGWSLFFLLFGSFIVGIPILLFSKKAESKIRQSTERVVLGYILFITFGLMSLLHILLIIKGNLDFAHGFPLSICFAGAGIYLINIGKGANNNLVHKSIDKVTTSEITDSYHAGTNIANDIESKYDEKRRLINDLHERNLLSDIEVAKKNERS